MKFLKKIFNDDERIIGLCHFKKQEKLRVFNYKCSYAKPVYCSKYEKNFFLL